MSKELLGSLELNRIYQMDCIDGMNNLIPENSVDLIITSPPYNLDIQYESYKDKMTYEQYLLWAERWLISSYRVLKNGGRICINVPVETNLFGKVFIMNDYINILEKIGFIRNSLIVWNKQNMTKRTAWGSWKSPSCPNIINPLEVIIVYSKNDRKKGGNKEFIDITREEFIEYSLGVWNFGSESAKRIGHPAPYPIELPHRCMKIFSYQNDIILDPFMGSGSTAVAAVKNKRKFIGFEISSKYIEIANKRLESIYNEQDDEKLLSK